MSHRGTVGTSTVDSLQGQIDQVASAVGVVAKVVADQAKSATDIKGPRATSTDIDEPIARDIRIPRARANHLNEALLRAVQSSQQIGQALGNYERAARSNEALLERAQQALSHLLSGPNSRRSCNV